MGKEVLNYSLVITGECEVHDDENENFFAVLSFSSFFFLFFSHFATSSQGVKVKLSWSYETLNK